MSSRTLVSAIAFELSRREVLAAGEAAANVLSPVVQGWSSFLAEVFVDQFPQDSSLGASSHPRTLAQQAKLALVHSETDSLHVQMVLPAWHGINTTFYHAHHTSTGPAGTGMWPWLPDSVMKEATIGAS
jgi:hypothetical protein